MKKVVIPNEIKISGMNRKIQFLPKEVIFPGEKKVYFGPEFIYFHGNLSEEETWRELIKSLLFFTDFGGEIEDSAKCRIAGNLTVFLIENKFLGGTPINKIPKKVKILGWEYQVNEVDFVINENELCLGQADVLSGEIQLYANLPTYRKWVTFFHEVVHGLDVLEELSEKGVIWLSWQITKFLADNNIISVGGDLSENHKK
jgi:hypothetical protein